MSQKQHRNNYQDVHGIVLLNKAKGISSNQALQKVRRLFNAKKAGHTGNLDPMATGLLPCCFGDATKVAGLLINSDKTYLARCVLGSQTDTGDATGTVIKEMAVTSFPDKQIQAITEKMLGKQQQIPPMYSALHHQGKRLYELARAGISVEREPREIFVHHFKLIKNADAYIDFEIKVSKGTYIRTLLEGFAIHGGSCAHMSALHRTQTGIFNASDMHSLEELVALKNPVEKMLNQSTALIEYPQINLTEEQTQAMIHGKVLDVEYNNDIYCLYDHNKYFLGLGEVYENSQLKVKKLFLKSYQQGIQVLA
ncbi:MAG: tRNA pseudouridine(55) synthase TruB [Proteobacteria bacterium]|nr:tRNA pseudouridine(55) synthase TruB [Pseudomonadota bacterium]